MIALTGDPHTDIQKAIEACRALIKTLSDPSIQPLEREAGFILAKALRLQIETLGLLNNPDVQQFLALQEQTRPRLRVRRFPDDFDLPATADR